MKVVLESWDNKYPFLVFKKVISAGLSSLWQKRCQNSIWYSMIILEKWNSLKHQYEAEFKNLDDSELLSSDFSGLRTSASSLTSLASAPSLASTASKALFHKRTSMSWWLDCPWHQNDFYCSLICWMNHQISKFLLISYTLSVGNCWGQPMLLFWKQRMNIKNLLFQDSKTTFKEDFTYIFQSVRAN